MSTTAAQQRDANREIINSNEAFILKSTWTFAAATTGAIGQHTLFTATDNCMAMVIAICSTDLESGGSATISVGSANNVAIFFEVTTATNIDGGEVWVAATPLADIGATLNHGGEGLTTIINDGADITIDILTATITAGVIDFYCLWRPLNNNASIVITTPA